MTTLHQLSFNFTFSEAHQGPHKRIATSWQIRHLSRRYLLPDSQARLYATFLDLPVEVRHD